MTQKKKLVFILPVNIIVIILSGYILISRYQRYKLKEVFTREQVVTPGLEQPIEPGIESTPELTIKPAESYRNILFQYRSSKAKDVRIIGDFNDWTPEKLKKVKLNLWEIALKLPPGKYKYNYLVDGEVKLDPNDLKPPVENKSRGFKSSVVVVTPKK